MVAWGDTGPRGRVISTGKTRHVGADLGHNHFGRVAGHPRNRIQQADSRFKRAAALLDLCIKSGSGLVEAIDLA
jgi:hypothetical protein